MGLHLDMLAAAATALSYGEGPSVPWGRIILAFLLCIGLAVMAIAFVRWRTGQGAPAPFWLPVSRGVNDGKRELELVERLALSPTTQLFVVRWGGKKLLVLSSPSGAQVLREEDAPESAA